MTARAMCLIQCDHDGCRATYRYDQEGAKYTHPSSTAARRLARTDGWRFAAATHSRGVPQFDFCPAHADQVEARALEEARI